jgi:hypothetical protein
MNNTLLTLRLAKNRISDPNNWIQGHFARDKNGWLTESESRNAVCWCSIGALRSAAKGTNQFSMNAMRVMENCIPLENGMNIAEYNDTHTHEEVMKLFDAAIELAEKGTP